MAYRILVALGGNAILSHTGKGTAEEQLANVRETCQHLAVLAKSGHHIAITHGNGPQVGDILLAHECAKESLPPMPLDVCGAESEGMIGYMLQQSMANELALAGIRTPVVTLLSQTEIHRDDPAFARPSKPIGPFYTAMEADKNRAERGWIIENDSGRGFRRLVPSPDPVRIVEEDAIRALAESGAILVACGGGGVPVIADESGQYRGVEAVIDKDHTAAILARVIGADILLILTDVAKVALRFGRPDQMDLDRLTCTEAARYKSEGHFAPGSMEPKIEAAISFLENGGKRVIITRPELADAAVNGTAGTTIVP